jgi:hypothetical protein
MNNNASAISAALALEALNWARKGYRVTRLDGAVAMTAAEKSEFARTGNPPEVKLSAYVPR